jgi:hypothetical protein
VATCCPRESTFDHGVGWTAKRPRDRFRLRGNHGKLICMRICFAVLFVLDLCGRGQSLPSIPDNLKPPANETLILQAHAVGDQIYICNASTWVFARPDAKLLDGSGKQIGSHSAGPTWEYSDGSRVVAKAAATATPDSNSIPWLLLKATAHQGEGVMKTVTSVLRLSTKGGMAPAGSCDAQHKGQEARSHYTAVYLFYSGL